uniref:2',5' RNA ligase n=1 Tax=Solibacter usitatus (strain Ellin6076) TaxID=234267 RepID=Q01UA6_SOLUE
MGFDSNGVLFQIPAEQRLNVFALVVYIPDPLGRFLDDLRKELVPGCNPHAHVSMLPPRPLAVDWQVASEQVRRCAAAHAPFEVTLGAIRRFPVTNVIYIELARGAEQFFAMHEAMNREALEFAEPFQYHPHVTLAQEIPPPLVEEVDRKAHQLWEGYDGPRTFRAERTAFVQNTLGNCWIDLAESDLGAVTV